MNRSVLLAATAAAGLLAVLAPADPAAAEQRIEAVAGGYVITPDSSIVRPEDRGVRAHTNIHMFVPAGRTPGSSQPYGSYETPASLACLYGVTTKVTGCNPQTLTKVATTGARAIAIVDAYDDPNAASDLAAYSAQFGLPAITSSNFQVVYASGSKPPVDSTGGWEMEEALDIEMAHALAPKAKIYLVEAASASTSALLAAETKAAQLVASAGGGEVSNSWGGSETSNEESYESKFTGQNIVFLASAGDSPGTGMPAVLHNVVSVGGTTVKRDSSGNYLRQIVWSSTGGGDSTYVPIPSWQNIVSGKVGTHRGTPDVALVADPSTGVWEYDSYPYNGQVLDWLVIGGTSVASPAVAAIINSAGTFAASSTAELTLIYQNGKTQADYTDITQKSCPNGGSLPGWDFCTGWGTPLGLNGK